MKENTLTMIKTSFKLFLVVCAILSFLVIASMIRLLLRDEKKWRPIVERLCQVHCQLCLKAIKAQVHFYKHHDESITSNQSHLIVSNHLSYLDILCMMCVKPWSFVTSMEIKKTFLLGHLCQLFGCVFIERRNRDNIDKEINVIASALLEGNSVCFFPEATSTDGTQVLPFKKSFFKAAINASRPVQLIAIKYLNKYGNALTSKERDSICWYGDMDFFPHLIRCIQLNGFICEIHFLDKLDPRDFDRDSLAMESHRRIANFYKLISNP